MMHFSLERPKMWALPVWFHVPSEGHWPDFTKISIFNNYKQGNHTHKWSKIPVSDWPHSFVYRHDNNLDSLSGRWQKKKINIYIKFILFNITVFPAL